MVESYYDTEEIVRQYLFFHYAEGSEQLPWSFGPVSALGFPQRCVEEGFELSRLPRDGRGLEIGCGVGRAAYALAERMQSVLALDYSAAFIAAARALQQQGNLQIAVPQTGKIEQAVTVVRPAGDPERIRFEQGDAMHLPESMGKFDAVLAANLLCRLSQPVRFLQRLPELVLPGGQLVLTTPNTWLESFTAAEYWLGATPETGEPLEALKQQLLPHFELARVWDMPFLIREHSRKYQWSVAQASRWIRK